MLDGAITDRGFIDHEDLDDLDDFPRSHERAAGRRSPWRFLSVDSFIQDPGNSQSLNLYSYGII